MAVKDKLRRFYGGPDPAANVTPAIARIYQQADQESAASEHRQAVDELQAEIADVRADLQHMEAEEHAEAIRWLRANDPAEVYKRKIERSAEMAREAAAAAEEQTMQDRWNEIRSVRQAEIEKLRAELITSGKVTDFSRLPRDLPVQAPTEWLTVDTGVPTYHKPHVTPDGRDAAGNKTLTFDVSPITGQKLNAAPPLPTPEEFFRAAAKEQEK